MKLPVAQTIVGAFQIPWRHRAEFARGLAVPFSGLVTLLLAWQFWNPEGLGLGLVFVTGLLLSLLYLALFCWLAVACHRLVLLKAEERGTTMQWTARETRFLLWLIGGYILYALTAAIGTSFVTAIASSFSSPTANPNEFTILRYLGTLPAWYLVGRFSLILPATALDHKTNLAHAWTLSAGNGWRLFALICLFPWALDGTADLLLSQADSHLAAVVFALSTPLLSVFEIAALSLAYRFLTRGAG